VKVTTAAALSATGELLAGDGCVHGSRKEKIKHELCRYLAHIAEICCRKNICLQPE
jgi:hypothetical protein